jgi:hypothetical protein
VFDETLKRVRMAGPFRMGWACLLAMALFACGGESDAGNAAAGSAMATLNGQVVLQPVGRDRREQSRPALRHGRELARGAQESICGGRYWPDVLSDMMGNVMAGR